MCMFPVLNRKMSSSVVLSPEKATLHRFSKEAKKIEALKCTLQSLSSKTAAIVTLSINQCNAAYGKFEKPGKTFSRADVDFTTNTEILFSFRSIFLKGFNMLQAYLDSPESYSSENHTELVLSRLLNYLLEKDDSEAVNTIAECTKMHEGDLAVRLAEHLFSKLCVSTTYTLDRSYQSSSSCGCGCKTDIKGHYGDTSIGNCKIWHGSLDIILGNNTVLVYVMDKERKPQSRDGMSKKEMKEGDNLEEYDVTSQLLAQTIVFSFSQRKNHPEFDNFLIPAVGVNRSNIIFYFYDSEQDILMKSPSFPLLERKKLTVLGILTSWFIVNCKFLCSGLTEEIKKEAKRANFFYHADCQLPMYQNNISIGGVVDEKPDLEPYQPWFILDSKFIDYSRDQCTRSDASES